MHLAIEPPPPYPAGLIRRIELEQGEQASEEQASDSYHTAEGEEESQGEEAEKD